MNRKCRENGWWMALLLSCLLAAGCGGDEATGADADGCIENVTRPCRCPNTWPGTMVCTAEGTFSECECAERVPITSAGNGVVSSGEAGSPANPPGAGGMAGAAGSAGAAGAAGASTADAGVGTGGTAGAAGSAGTAGEAGGAGGTAGNAGAAGLAGAAGMPGAAGTAGIAGAPPEAGAAGVGGAAGAAGEPGAAGANPGPPDPDLEPFSFFVVSYAAMERLSGTPNGFGGDLRYGEATGIAGADKICREVAEESMPGSAQKGWVAFLSATTGGPNGGPIHAIERVGDGPWYDRRGRTVALTTTDLANVRPLNADPAIVNDLPNEDGIPNQSPDGFPVDNHHVLTGSNEQGRLAESNPGVTCQDWTSAVGEDGQPRCGMSWPRGGGMGFPGMGGMGSHWISGHTAPGCAAVVNLIQDGPGNPFTLGVGSGGGYGAIYCFAQTP